MFCSLKISPFVSLNIPIIIDQKIDTIYLSIESECGIKDSINFSQIKIDDGISCYPLANNDDLIFESSSRSKGSKNITNSFKNFATKKQLNPWIKIIFKREIYIKEIFICSRLEFQEKDLSKLIIKTSLNDKSIFTKNFYNSEDNKSDIINFINTVRSSNNLSSNNVKFFNRFIKRLHKNPIYIRHFFENECKLALNSNNLNRLSVDKAKLAYFVFDDLPEQVFKFILITLITSGNNKDATSLLAKYAKEINNDVIEYINKKLIDFLPSEKYPLQITSHGIRSSKRSLKNIGSKNLVEFMNDIFVIFEKYNYDLIACYGTLLGIYRDNDFIPHDDDIDLLLITDNINILSEIDKNLLSSLENKNYVVKDRKIGSQFIQIYPKHLQTRLDIFIGLVDGDEIILPMENVLSRGIKKDIILPRKSTKFLDYKIYIPNDAEEFLKERYGANWHIPDIIFRNKERKIRSARIAYQKFTKIDAIKIAVYNIFF